VKIDELVEETTDVADKYSLKLIEIDRTENIISLKLEIDSELFIKIYGNVEKDKLNLALVLKKKRLYGYDSVGGKSHWHSFDNPDGHVFVDEKKSIWEFVRESMRYLEEKEIL
jgi:hypothetical protein